MKIMLITPPVLYTRHMPPGPAYLKAYLERAGHEVRCRDLNTEIEVYNDGDDVFWSQPKNCSEFFDLNRPLFKKWVDEIEAYDPAIVGFTVWTTTLALSLKLALMIKLKNPKRVIVFGGYLAGARGRQLFDYPQIDVLAAGEGEETLLELARTLEEKGSLEACAGAMVRINGEILEGGPGREIKELDSLPFPDFSDFDQTKYFNKNSLPIVFSRGCSWRCAFCTTFLSWKTYRTRSAANILKEIELRVKQHPGTQRFEVCDPACNQDLAVLSELCDAIVEKKYGFTFSALAQIRPDMGPELLAKMKKAGFHTLNFGMESGSDKILKKMRKLYTSEVAEKVIRDTCAAGINVVLNFVVGFPGEEPEDFRQTLDFIDRNKEFIANVAPAHECDILDTEIAACPAEYGVIVPLREEFIQNWETTDKRNVTDVRRARKQEFDGFLNSIKMPIKCGVYDRQEDSR